MRQEARGFTLIELMVVILVAAVLLFMAVSGWTHATSAASNSAARAELGATVLDVLGHAANRGVEVIVCPATGAKQCTGGSDWSGGWIAFADTNGNRLHDSQEPLIRQATALAHGVRLHSTAGRTRLVFQPGGSNAGSNVTFTLCDDRGAAKASTLILANDGRLRQGTPTTTAAKACLAGG